MKTKYNILHLLGSPIIIYVVASCAIQSLDKAEKAEFMRNGHKYAEQLGLNSSPKRLRFMAAGGDFRGELVKQSSASDPTSAATTPPSGIMNHERLSLDKEVLETKLQKIENVNLRLEIQELKEKLASVMKELSLKEHAETITFNNCGDKQ